MGGDSDADGGGPDPTADEPAPTPPLKKLGRGGGKGMSSPPTLRDFVFSFRYFVDRNGRAACERKDRGTKEETSFGVNELFRGRHRLYSGMLCVQQFLPAFLVFLICEGFTSRSPLPFDFPPRPALPWYSSESSSSSSLTSLREMLSRPSLSS